MTTFPRLLFVTVQGGAWERGYAPSASCYNHFLVHYPLRACTARVKYICLCVCVCMCVGKKVLKIASSRVAKAFTDIVVSKKPSA